MTRVDTLTDWNRLALDLVSPASVVAEHSDTEVHVTQRSLQVESLAVIQGLQTLNKTWSPDHVDIYFFYNDCGIISHMLYLSPVQTFEDFNYKSQKAILILDKMFYLFT